MNIISKINSYMFFDGFILLYPLYTVMFADNGLNALQISLLLVIFSVATLSLEIPSGIWADKYSRKNVIFIGQLLRAIGFFVWFLFPTFTGFAIGFALWGAKCALVSGTFESLVYDELKSIKKEKEYVKVIGKANSINSASSLIAAFLASAAILLGYAAVINASVVAGIIAAIIIVLFPETQHWKKTADGLSVLKKGFSFIIKKHILKLIIFVSAVMTIRDGLGQYWPLYLEYIGIPLVAIGAIIGVMSVAEIIGNYFAHYFERYSDKLLAFGLILFSGLFFIANYLFIVYSVFFIWFFILFTTIIIVIFEGRFQHVVPSKIRATVSSVNEFASEGSQIIVFLLFGFFSEISNQSGFNAVAFYVVAVGIMYFVLKMRTTDVFSKKSI